MEVRCPFDLGLVDDFDMLGKIWEHGISELRADAREHPLLIVEPSHSLRAHSEEVLRMAFETLGAPAIFLAKAPVMQAFALGRANAMVVDIGASGTRAVGVHDGHVLRAGTVLSEVGGAAISSALAEALSAGLPRGQEQPIWPRSLLRKTQVRAGGSAMDVDGAGAGAGTGGGTKLVWEAHPRTDLQGVTRSFRDTWALEVLDDMKKTCCSVKDTGCVRAPPPTACVSAPPLTPRSRPTPTGTLTRSRRRRSSTSCPTGRC